MDQTSPVLVACPHAADCGGCARIGEPYEQQLAGKAALVRECLAGRVELADIDVAPIRGAARVTHYRVRAKLVASGGALGLYARSTHRVVDIPDCEVLSARLARAVAVVREHAARAPHLLALDAREVDDGVLLTLIIDERAERADVERFADVLVGASTEVRGVSVARRARESAQVLGGVPTPLRGEGRARHHLSPDAPWHYAVPGGFVQSHAGQAAELYTAIETALRDKLGSLSGRTVLELYAGAGALALRLAARGARVTLADSFAPNLRHVEQAAATQHLGLAARACSAEAALATIEMPMDAVIVDPPRRGLSPAVRRALGRLAPRVVVYVSCEPRTFARDLSHLRQLGLRASTVTPWDMLPLSDAVELLALLEPAPPPEPVVLYAGTDLIAVDKPAYLPTTPQGEYARSLLDAVRALPNCDQAVPIHRLDIGTSGVCLFARHAGAAGNLAAALTTGSKEYVLLARGTTHKKGRIERAVPDEQQQLRDAVTRYQRERSVGTHSLVRAFPEQGRRHQLRRHFAAIGHPVLGDGRYGDAKSNRHFEERHGLDRTFLHCARITLTLEATPLTIESALPADLRSVVRSLERSAGDKPALRRE